ncbi:MAG TPA: hypothetical protein VFJ19_12660 [Nocardioidaceae bacterium]|nr:hypothetical protein [Nocardioidaceae bacterium]
MPGSRARGRPSQSVALPDTRFTREHVDGAIGWLLRSNRLSGADEDLRALTRFAAALPTAMSPSTPPFAPSTVSRWETGAQAVPYAAVVRYERLLNLPPSLLVSTIDLLHRHFADRVRMEPVLDRRLGPPSPAEHAALAETVEAVHEGRPVSGRDWDAFSAAMCAAPQILLPRPDTAEEVTRRLLSEMLVADDLAWMLRYEAFARLLMHPVYAAAAVDVCATMARDPTNQVFLETISVLDGSVHPDAARHVVSLLEDPTTDRAFVGALLACVRKARFGHFTPEQAHRVAGIVSALIADADADEATRRIAVRVLALLRKNLATRSAVAQFPLPKGPAMPSVSATVMQAGDALVDELHQSTRRAPGSSLMVDKTLPALLRAAVLDPVPDQRLFVSMLLRSSPYRAALAPICARRLVEPQHPELRPALLSLTRVISGPEQAREVRGLILDPDMDTELRASVARSLGHLRGEVEMAFLERALGEYGVESPSSQSHGSTEILTGLVYSLGIGGHLDLMAGLPSEQLPRATREAVGWWLALPPEVIASVQPPSETDP